VIITQSDSSQRHRNLLHHALLWRAVARFAFAREAFRFQQGDAFGNGRGAKRVGTRQIIPLRDDDCLLFQDLFPKRQ